MPTNILPYTSRRLARTRAVERRKWLLAALQSADNGPPRTWISESVPELAETRAPVLGESEEERAGQFTRLRWQLPSDALLLLERVTDAVFLAATDSPERVTAVKLAPLRRALVQRNLFPWRVVIATGDAEHFRDRLLPLRDWLGIGVDIDEPANIEPLGRCTAGYGGLEGVVGGVLRAPEPLSMTCGHVVSADCQSLWDPAGRGRVPRKVARPVQGPPPTITCVPDAVLLRHDTPCFAAPPSDIGVVVSPGPIGWLEECMSALTPLRKTHPEASAISGVVNGVLSSTSVRGTVYRFPHVEIIPMITKYAYGLLPLPLFNARFSRRGDSGAWVRDTKAGTWTGMIVAGDDEKRSFAIEAGALLDFFRQTLGMQSLPLAMTWNT